MKITVFNGSPRGDKSNTNIIAQAFIAGAKEAGATVENIFLIEKDIKHCTGCFSCWFKTPGKCVLNDDMGELLEKCKDSDIVCIGTPVYLWNMTACTKNFLDRMIPIKHPNIQEQDGHYDMATKAFKMPEVVVLSNAGFPGDKNFEVMKQVMASLNPIVEIYRNCGMILQTKDPSIKDKVDNYLFNVKQVAKKIVQGDTLNETDHDKMNMDLLSVENYISYISK